jgi:Putative peptidoglycan binding domain
VAWRNCQASLAFVAAVNAKYPNRDKASDGTIGDAAHATRSSDHNPWRIDSHGQPVVGARDVDKDGVDAPWIVEQLRLLGRAGDRRLTGGGYVIFNRRITTPDYSGWKVYTGTNPHDHHFHVSFSQAEAGYDDAGPWPFLGGAPMAATLSATPAAAGATLTRGMTNDPRVAALQRFLNAYGWSPALPLLPVTGNYLDQTVAVVKAAQAQCGVTGPDADGTICGPRTIAAFAARGARW